MLSASLAPIFTPSRIAVFGASADPNKTGNKVVKNLRDTGFPGEVLPINPQIDELWGYRAIPSIDEMPDGVDLFVTAVPAAIVPDAVEKAVAKGVKGAIILANGFGEIGGDGKVLETRLVAAARKGNIRFIGPNGLGIRNFHGPVHVSQQNPPKTVTPGPIAFISQSGSLGNAAFAEMARCGVGMSKFVSVGNMASIGHDDLFHYLRDDPETEVVTSFVEGVSNPESFLDAVAALTAVKPLVMLKGGRSEIGGKAALSHTSSLAGDGRVWVDLLREAGATVVDGLEELFDAAVGFAWTHGLPKSRRVAVYTLGGGAGVVATDQCIANGLTLPDLSEALEQIRPLTFRHASLRNPVDTSTSFPRENYTPVISAVVSQDMVDSMVAIGMGPDIPELADGIIAASQIKPVVSCVTGQRPSVRLRDAKIANYPTPERAVRVLRHLADRGARLQQASMAQSNVIDLGPMRSGVHTEAQSKALLATCGLPVTEEAEVMGLPDARAAAARIGYPVAVKVSAAEVAHKSDRGGVLLNIGDDETLAAAVRTMDERFPGAAILVQQMVRSGVELIIGAERREDTGPAVMVGMGGVLAEVLDDVVFCRAPLSEQAALAALARLKSQKLLDGYRDLPPVDRAAVARIMATLSAIIAGTPSVAEVDLNPVVCGKGTVTIVDALIRVV